MSDVAFKFVPADKFKLDEGEKSHPLWQRLKKFLLEELAEKRAANDSIKLDPFQTAMLRGHIRCLKSLIALDEQLPVIDTDDV